MRLWRSLTDLQLKPAASKESAGLGHLAAVCWPLVLRACGRSRSERRWGSRARARDFFPATQLKKRFCTKKHRQRAARFLGLLGKSRRCVAQLSVRGAHFVPGRWSPCLLALLVLVIFWFLAPPHFWYNNNRKRPRYEHRRRANKTNPTTQQPCWARLERPGGCGDSNGGCRDETQNSLLCVGGKHTPLVGPRCHFRQCEVALTQDRTQVHGLDEENLSG